MNTYFRLAAAAGLALALSSCGLLQSAISVPTRFIQSGVRTVTGDATRTTPPATADREQTLGVALKHQDSQAAH